MSLRIVDEYACQISCAASINILLCLCIAQLNIFLLPCSAEIQNLDDVIGGFDTNHVYINEEELKKCECLSFLIQWFIND